MHEEASAMMYNWDSLLTQNKGQNFVQSAPQQEEAMHIGIAEINLRARNFELMREFYTRALGVVPRDTRSSEDRNVRACRFDLPGIDLLMLELPADSTHGEQELIFRVGSVDNVEAAYERLKNVPGCEPVQFPRYTHDNRYETIVKDPEGNSLIFRD
jgi:hypothetical protein